MQEPSVGLAASPESSLSHPKDIHTNFKEVLFEKRINIGTPWESEFRSEQP